MKNLLSMAAIFSLSFALSSILLLIIPALGFSEDPAGSTESKELVLSQNVSCSELIALLTRQEQNTSRELRLIKRDIAALNQKLDKPGIKDIVAGIGFILGLFGIAALINSRRSKTHSRS